jgi:hypothetical protein
MTRQRWTEAPTHWKLDLIGNLFSVRGNYFEMASRGRMRRAHTDPLPPVGAATGTTPLHSVAAVCTTRSLGSKFRIRFRINYVIYRGYWSRKGSHFAVSANYFMRSLVIGIPAHEASYASPDNREQLLSRAGLDRQSAKTATCFRMNASTVMGGVPVSSSTSVLVPAKTPF